MLAPGDRTRSIGAARGLQRVGMGILVMYLVMGRRERIRQKALGTAAGASAAVVVAIVAPASWALTVLAVVAMLLAVLLRATYGQLYGLYTFALVLYLATPGPSIPATGTPCRRPAGLIGTSHIAQRG